jgi:hypothetical protein
MGDTVIWSDALESSITIFEASFTLICDVYSTGVTYDDYQLTIVISLWYRALEYSSLLILSRYQ